jgi:diguanylate cyclase (GGDEF)-like protein
MNIISYLEKRGKIYWAITGILLVLLVAFIEFLSDPQLSFTLFYLLAISVVTWFGGREIGIVISIASIFCWFTVDIVFLNHPYSNPAISYLNFAIRFIVFLIVTLLISALRKAQENEKALARIDYLTGAVNTRFFYELMQKEIERSKRNKHPFTIVYLDIDNFKYINDHYGHSVGDEVLYSIANQAKKHLRKVDVVARLGGDEFAFLLPETNQREASDAISKVQTSLLDEVRSNDWPVTFSIGVLTCTTPSKSIEKIIKQADEVMYSVKNNGKNSISYSVDTG